jgi:hypothetical protein
MTDEQRPYWRVMLEIGCRAPEEFFMPYSSDIPQAHREMLDQHGPIPCEGTGEVSPFCISPDCHWVEWDGDWDKELV